jgi:hypothetical protein
MKWQVEQPVFCSQSEQTLAGYVIETRSDGGTVIFCPTQKLVVSGLQDRLIDLGWQAKADKPEQGET